MKSMKSKLAVVMMLAVVLGSAQAFACVGKTLVVGTTGTVQQNLMAQMLSLLISERTGTTVKVVQVDSHHAAHQALLKAELDMYVEYTGVGQVELLQRAAIADPADLYKAVKAGYNEELNLIWLKPFGFENSEVSPAGTVGEAAPVVRKDTLKKFPALARLINKLGGRIDGQSIRSLEAAAGSEDSRTVARQFLRSNRLI